MNRTEKKEVIDDLNAMLQSAKSVVLVDFRGMKVADASQLRRQMKKANCGYHVVKNTLALIASKDTALEVLKDHFKGPTAIAYSRTDPVQLAKLLTELAKTVPTLQLKVALVEGKLLDGKDVAAIAKLPSRVELIGKLMMMLNSPVRQLASVLAAPARNLAYALSQIKK